MINLIYSVFDEKAHAFLQPFFIQNDAVAIRAMINCVNDPKHNFGMHPADYTLFRVGTFDDSTAILTSEKTPLGNLIEFKTQQELDLNQQELDLNQPNLEVNK